MPRHAVGMEARQCRGQLALAGAVLITGQLPPERVEPTDGEIRGRPARSEPFLAARAGVRCLLRRHAGNPARVVGDIPALGQV